MHGMVAAGEGGGEGRNRSAQVSGLSQCRVEGSGALMLGGEFGGRFLYLLVSHLSMHLFFQIYIFIHPFFSPIYGFISAHGAPTTTTNDEEEVVLTFISVIDYSDSVGARNEGPPWFGVCV